MTDQLPNVSDSSSNEAVINEALGVIDGALAKMMQRELVSSGEVADLLLDVRTLLTDVEISKTDDVDIAVVEPIVDLA
ncbi:hypothetical protein [Ilumatobacter coccineus]|jgi:hypothetical protein|uniref:Uncharacterized protein n=1 Tax=Ilumatobacter coccineus (strain NBRC 103263 / KCTC 29153 / YM16-304) TaxID=1313172 RepID=A0A6C7E5N5_ILUCY|nr:hypothetical protein [Ilumatobacter coccineus]BAN01861.1 hypothetical protein YM304_15470 [Ilumatobacter coccineus YM16-304]